MALGFRWFVATLSSYRLSPTYHNSVSHPRSSNRTCGTTASGFPTDFTLQYTKKTHFICDKRAHLCFLLHSKVWASSGNSGSRWESLGIMPITPPHFLQKHVRSKGPSLPPVSRASQVLWPSPTPAQTSTIRAVRGRYPPSGTGLPRCIRYFPDMPSSLPRWTRSSASIGSFLVLLRPSPNIGRVGIHIFTFEACSRFTHVTACRFAATLKGVLLSPELQTVGLPLRLSG